mmetsp:Transcript_15361/g.45317  ORF Transcript_15361/g.45317 Transcript_15361/m.45317 type:complete len:346 (-) Transcript_15361:493-1530(-)
MPAKRPCGGAGRAGAFFSVAAPPAMPAKNDGGPGRAAAGAGPGGAAAAGVGRSFVAWPWIPPRNAGAGRLGGAAATGGAGSAGDGGACASKNSSSTLGSRAGGRGGSGGASPASGCASAGGGACGAAPAGTNAPLRHHRSRSWRSPPSESLSQPVESSSGLSTSKGTVNTPRAVARPSSPPPLWNAVITSEAPDGARKESSGGTHVAASTNAQVTPGYAATAFAECFVSNPGSATDALSLMVTAASFSASPVAPTARPAKTVTSSMSVSAPRRAAARSAAWSSTQGGGSARTRKGRACGSSARSRHRRLRTCSEPSSKRQRWAAPSLRSICTSASALPSRATRRA